MTYLIFAAPTAGEQAEQESLVHSASGSRPTSQWSNFRSRPQSVARGKRGREEKLRKQLEEAATNLLQHFNNKNLDALLRLTRNTLEGLRKRISSSSTVHYLGDTCLAFYSRVYQGSVSQGRRTIMETLLFYPRCQC